MVESLSLLVNEAKNVGKFNGISFSSALAITRLLFVDDVVIFGSGSLAEWGHFKAIIDVFTLASGMVISVDKSSFLHNNFTIEKMVSIQLLFPYKMERLDVGFQYLGYWVKPLNYRVCNWKWILKKFEHKIQNWSFRFLSLGGHLILLKSVLSGILVY